jgi:hypothetical protein
LRKRLNTLKDWAAFIPINTDLAAQNYVDGDIQDRMTETVEQLQTQTK